MSRGVLGKFVMTGWRGINEGWQRRIEESLALIAAESGRVCREDCGIVSSFTAPRVVLQTSGRFQDS
jgi:hypothetical protein